MKRVAEVTARLIRAVKRAYGRKGAFLGVFVLVFLANVIVLGWLDLLPEAPTEPSASVAVSGVPNAGSVALVPEVPELITIPTVGVSARVANPGSTDVPTLDNALLKGAVRYPTSAKLGEDGNVVLFGHSSYLPIVNNQAYKTFNGIQKLKAGDQIMVSSANTTYTYRVRSVTKESADYAVIPLSVAGRVLTLSTCDSFASKSDRFVVIADFVESHPIST